MKAQRRSRFVQSGAGRHAHRGTLRAPAAAGAGASAAGSIRLRPRRHGGWSAHRSVRSGDRSPRQNLPGPVADAPGPASPRPRRGPPELCLGERALDDATGPPSAFCARRRVQPARCTRGAGRRQQPGRSTRQRALASVQRMEGSRTGSHPGAASRRRSAPGARPGAEHREWRPSGRGCRDAPERAPPRPPARFPPPARRTSPRRGRRSRRSRPCLVISITAVRCWRHRRRSAGDDLRLHRDVERWWPVGDDRLARRTRRARSPRRRMPPEN